MSNTQTNVRKYMPFAITAGVALIFGLVIGDGAASSNTAHLQTQNKALTSKVTQYKDQARNAQSAADNCQSAYEKETTAAHDLANAVSPTYQAIADYFSGTGSLVDLNNAMETGNVGVSHAVDVQKEAQALGCGDGS